MKILFKKCKQKKIEIIFAVEVGVYLPETSNIVDFIQHGTKSMLVEADPETVKILQNFFSENKNVTIICSAIYNKSGEIELCRYGSSTFISNLTSSPALVNENFRPEINEKFTTKCITFDTIDDGSIDLLSIDIEGAEWFVLEKMISRPKIISIETHGKLYTNPYMPNILEWLNANNYILWYKDASDSVYVKSGTFKLTLLDAILLLPINIFIKYKFLRTKFMKLIKKQ